MTRSFFQNLERHVVSFLLISGQATVLYDAAEFSEDLDLWIEPSSENIQRLLSALRASKARYYKLTPPVAEANLLRGHGFHFSIGEESPFYLDVMGQPPRVGAFDPAFKHRQNFETDWGNLPVIGLKDLVEIKKTQRLRDYSIISALARRWLDRPEFKPSPHEFQWVMSNLFSLADLESLAHEHPEAAAHWANPDYKEFVFATAESRQISESLEEKIQSQLQSTVSALQKADRDYWKPIISELRGFKARNELLPEGAFV